MNLDLINKESVRSEVPQRITKGSGPEGMSFSVQRTVLCPVRLTTVSLWDCVKYGQRGGEEPYC